MHTALAFLSLMVPVQPFSMPLYRLEPAKTYRYSTTSESRAGGQTSGREVAWEFRVVGEIPLRAAGQQPEPGKRAGWHMLARSAERSYRTSADGQRRENPVRTSWGLFDMDIHGRLSNVRFSGGGSLRSVWLELPRDTVTAKAGWVVLDSASEETDYQRLDNKTLADSLWLIRTARQTPLDSIYQRRSSALVYFDTRQGLVVLREGQGSDDYGNGVRTSTSVTRLDSIVPAAHDQRAIRFADELGQWLLVEEACDSLIEAASERRDTVALSYAVAESLVAGAGRVLTDSTVLELIKEAGDDLREQIPELVAEAKELRRRIGKPAPEWTLQDLAGSEHSLEDFRGRVVLLDFWYRACPWCMRAMPALNELAHEHAQKKVAVIGMNTDASLADAMYVVKRLGLSYLNLRSGDEYKQYGVKGFPTLFVLDPQGRIADIHVGYSKDMKEKLGRAIRRAWGED